MQNCGEPVLLDELVAERVDKGELGQTKGRARSGPARTPGCSVWYRQRADVRLAPGGLAAAPARRRGTARRRVRLRPLHRRAGAQGSGAGRGARNACRILRQRLCARVALLDRYPCTGTRGAARDRRRRDHGQRSGARPRHRDRACSRSTASRVTAQWSTLVNPGAAVPATIQALTGITQEMVERAPRFGELAGELYERLAGRVFVAHNARFDYGFLRREFERAGLKYQREDAVHRAALAPALRPSRRARPRQPDRAPRPRLRGAPPRAAPTPTRSGSSCASRPRSTATRCSTSPRARSRASRRCRRTSTARRSTRCRKPPASTSSTTEQAQAALCRQEPRDALARAAALRHRLRAGRRACGASSGSAPRASWARCCARRRW